jgi:hypothetical protein
MNFRESFPDGFRAGFAVALATEEPAQASDQPYFPQVEDAI